MLALLAAILADAVDLKCMARSQVTVFSPNFLFQMAHFLGEKLHRTAALGANHVVMAAPVVLVLIAGDAVMECDFAGQSALGQQFQRSVDSGVSNAFVFFLNQPMEFIGRKMIARLQKCPQDRVALRCLLQAHALQMPMQNILSLSHHLARNRGLIIDAILQHGGLN
jgi:hypothetical protein